ncbi:two-component system regulatory protein YycI [Paenibacillus harenae]|uniref:Regulatory protein YycI of two-component signal transduction system YycFG n=1 Tax=Paenibacillus harenae TaxID=306543 RepID=A0ABT9U428_PAEHA|nr:two-component system regulatory protein YycI [Paenibacillus harenae]MDQ0061567.1 regulatory protein YycI of two-component signal transduction system YycFG [Paenibacillus harenae]MDQ0113204.1 regulatory protein YycI of two-component signal transduction system YycFG [Paenibacillus harenae]
MDWGRAKSVLIFSFLLLNLLLGYQLWLDIREQRNVNVNSAELPQDKVLLMQQKGISLRDNLHLPLETPELRDITYLLHSDSRKNAEPIMLETPVDSRIIFTQSELVKTLGNIIPELNQYVYDSLVSDAGVSVFHRMTEGRPMFDVKLELHHSFQKITGYQQDRIEILSTGEAKQVLPAAKVITSLIETYLPNGSVITDIQLGYHGQIFDSERQVSTPSWRVMLEDGQIYYVHAISGEVATDEEQVETAGLR